MDGAPGGVPEDGAVVVTTAPRPLVALVGRPNVGKSTLFNRLVGRRLAIVQDVPGVTRDRHYADAEAEGRPYRLIDTGGFVAGEQDELLTAVREQAQLAVEECQGVLLVVDGRAGITAADQEVAVYLRRSGKPVVLVVNKLDTERHRQALESDIYRLGFPEPVAVSAEHALGLGELEARIAGLVPAAPEVVEGPEDAGAIRLAIVGRPNVGKSTLINSLLKQKRLVATATPGTTRDPIDAELRFGGRRYVLTDTAGIRRKRSIAQRLEQFAVVASLKVIERSDVAVLLMDATEPAVDQDAKIAAVAEAEGRALLVVVNKWDLIQKDRRKEEAFRAELKHHLKFVAYAPILFTSALTGQRVEKVLEIGALLYDQLQYRVPTPQLNRLLESIQESHPSPLAPGGRSIRLYYMAQVGTSPPAFTITSNRPEAVPDAYRRYLNNQLRETFDLRVPLRLFFRPRPGSAKRAARQDPRRRRRR